MEYCSSPKIMKLYHFIGKWMDLLTCDIHILNEINQIDTDSNHKNTLIFSDMWNTGEKTDYHGCEKRNQKRLGIRMENGEEKYD